MMLHGSTQKQAEQEVAAAIDRWVYYAGWCDKYQAVYSSVNPTNSSHFNFSIQEPTGVVGVMAPNTSGLLGLVSMIAPVITGGNTCVVIASESKPLPAVTFAEVLATSDLPGGVVNLMTGYRSELLKPWSRTWTSTPLWWMPPRKDRARDAGDRSHLQPEACGVSEGF
jgi:acyl-CoA reductase-like NAD-dependent aldehyde dehydrogenase